MRKLITIAAVAVLLPACQARVDTSSPQAYSASIQKLLENKSPAQKADFQHALAALAFGSADPADGGMFSNADPTSPVFMGAADKIKGKTFEQVIKAGYEAQLQALNNTIAEDVAAAQRAQSERQKNAVVFDNIHVDNARYRAETNILSMREPVISFDITNGSKLPIKAIYLHGLLSSPGRAIPWVSSEINYDFEGGLEPGEHQHLDLSPNQFGDWAAKDTFATRPDLQLSLTLANVEGPDGTKLIHDDADDADAKKVDAAQKERIREEVQKKLSSL
jgi:hypothetical protein